MQARCPRTMALGKQLNLEFGWQSETTLLCVVIRDPSDISSTFCAFPSQVQPLILLGTGRPVPLPPRTSLPGGHRQGDLGDLLMEIQLARDLGLSCYVCYWLQILFSVQLVRLKFSLCLFGKTD